MKEIIVDWRETKLQYGTKGYQHAVRFLLKGGGRTRPFRLRNIEGKPLLVGEADPRDVMVAIMNLNNELIVEDKAIPGSKYKTCSEAMEKYFEWRKEYRNDKGFRYKAGAFLEYFGDTNPMKLNRNATQEFIDSLIERKYSYNAVRLKVLAASALFTWLEKQKQWYTKNPFSGLIKENEHRFKAMPPEKSTIAPEEYLALWDVVQTNRFRPLRRYMELAFCTGLRKIEIKNLNINHLDRNALTWSVHVTKTTGREFYRRIAVPQRLVTFLANENLTGGHIPLSNVGKLLREARKLAGVYGVTPKLFRADFAHRMETAGANDYLINLHQGRAQTGVIFEHYLTHPDRAVRLCRSYITAMFGEKPVALERVK